MQDIFEQVEKELNHSFHQKDCLQLALTHSSYSNERQGVTNNERLEFLGDAVIGLVVADLLMQRLPDVREGHLSRLRSEMVSRKILAEMALKRDMGKWLLLGKGEKQTGGSEKHSLLANVFEALMGAFYIDAGLEKVRKYLVDAYEPFLNQYSLRETEPFLDRKTLLQEKTQREYKSTPVYQVVDSWGLEHEKNFKVAIEINGKVIAYGEGKSKKAAEQQAAENALKVLEI